VLPERDAKIALAIAYASIAVLLVATWFVGNLPYGVLAVPPLLVIAAYGRRLVAVITAVILGPLNVYVDRVVPPRIAIPSGVDTAITLSVILVGVIFVGDALRRYGQYFESRLSRAEEDAVRDVVTKMPNRRAFEKQLKSALASGNEREKIAVLFADLDGFKEVNDTLGHEVGDKALAAAGDRLAHVLRDTDFVARLGGDEFGIIVPRLRERKDIDRIIQGIERAFSTPFNVNLTRVNLGISIGSSVYPDDATTSNELLTLADEHMYEIKRSRKTV
jgi:diguanylate cyclase (GGDEF)-like protein